MVVYHRYSTEGAVVGSGAGVVVGAWDGGLETLFPLEVGSAVIELPPPPLVPRRQPLTPALLITHRYPGRHVP